MSQNVKVVTAYKKKVLSLKNSKLQYHKPSTYDHNVIIFRVNSITYIYSVCGIEVLSILNRLLKSSNNYHILWLFKRK